MPTNGYNFEDKGRIPVRPLSFENKDLALAKEIIVDYESGTIYVKREDGKIIVATTSEETMTAISEYIAEHPEILTEITITKTDGEQITIQQGFSEIYDNYDQLLDTIEKNKAATDKAIEETKTSLNQKIDDNINTINDNIAKDKAVIITKIEDADNSLDKKIDDTKTAIENTAEETYSKIGHDHSYAGSSSVGGPATSANKVNQKLIIKLYTNSTDTDPATTEFDGSAARTIDASAKVHDHDDTYYKKTGGTINGSVTIGETLTVNNNELIRGNSTVNGKSTVGSQKVEGNSSVDSLDVTNNANVGGDLTVVDKAKAGSQEITGNSSVGGTSTTKDLSVTNNATIAGKTTTNSLDITKAANVGGDATFNGKIILTSDCYGTDLPSSGVEGQLFFKIINN